MASTISYVDRRSCGVKPNGTTLVAILSTPSFDATLIDISTIALAGAPVATKKNGTWMASFEDVNKDGRLDLVFHVTTTKLQLNSASAEAVGFLVLTSFGLPFVVVPLFPLK